jgi:hypothetical protein
MLFHVSLPNLFPPLPVGHAGRQPALDLGKAPAQLAPEPGWHGQPAGADEPVDGPLTRGQAVCETSYPDRERDLDLSARHMHLLLIGTY